MLKSVEIKAEMKSLSEDIRNLLAENKVTEAAELKASLQAKQLLLDETLKEEETSKEMKGGKQLMETSKKMSVYAALNMAVKKTILNQEIPEDVKMTVAGAYEGTGNYGHIDATHSGERGGYLIPIEMLPLKEYYSQYPTLRPYVDTITTEVRSGWLPTTKYSGSENYNDALINFDELDEIDKAQLKFGKLDYKMKDYGLIIPVSRQLIDDASSDILGLVSRNFIRRQAMLENAKILAIFDTTEQTGTVDTSTSGTALYSALKKAYNETLLREYGKAAKIITNRTGLNMLDCAVDNEGRYILEQDVHSVTEPFSIGGHEVIVIDNEALPNSAEGKAPFYVGDFYNAAAIVSRQAIEIASDESAGFTSYSVLVRAVSRFDFLVKDIKAIVKIEAE